jgi:cephalosporin hydroxylase
MKNLDFENRNKMMISKMKNDSEVVENTNEWFKNVSRYEYSYHFEWMGRPIIQFPQDIVAMQEIIWKSKPDVIVETGIAHGGSLIFYASILELIGHGEVVGIDIDIRSHNRTEIENHPMYKRITMLEGDSTNQDIASKVYEICKNKKNILIILDSNHTHEHVVKELNLYSPLVTVGSYLVIMDTVVEDLPENPDRPWGKGNNPKTAVKEFLKKTDRFVVDEAVQSKLLITVAPEGYLKCIK